MVDRQEEGSAKRRIMEYRASWWLSAVEDKFHFFLGSPDIGFSEYHGSGGATLYLPSVQAASYESKASATDESMGWPNHKCSPNDRFQSRSAEI